MNKPDAKPLMDVLRIYHASAPSEAISNLTTLARCLGISSQLIDLESAGFPVTDPEMLFEFGSGPVVLDLGSLSRLIPPCAWNGIRSRLRNAGVHALLLTHSATETENAILRVLSHDSIRGVLAAGAPSKVSFPVGANRLSSELSGHQFKRSSRGTFALDVKQHSEADAVMVLEDGLPSFVSIRSGTSEVFAWATGAVFDMDRLLEKELEFEEALDEYIPAIIFLRSAFGERCWRSPFIGANIVIDDPTLVKKYGFIRFPVLLDLAKTLGFHVTVAFIPWNHWRTRKRSLKRFLSHAGAFSICAHGCDHTKDEFRTSDYGDLLRRSHLAADRLDHLQERTGMKWERMLVCPREDYSAEALQAFADSGRFLGLVNTGCIPRNLESPRVRASDLLLPAQDAFFGFPIFKRHYWSDISVFAMAAFLGKPTILVEHHSFFRDQYRSLKDFVKQLGTTCPAARWSSLTDLANRTCQWRRIGSATLEVRFFTDEFEMSNPDRETRNFCFRRRIPSQSTVESVLINRTPVSFEQNEDFICFEAQLPGNGAASIRIERLAVRQPGIAPGKLKYAMGVAMRRFLSEFRDNCVARNDNLLHLANRLMQILHLRGTE